MSNSDKTLIRPSIKDCLNVANSLIAKCNLLVPQVNHFTEINSNLIMLLYEKITGSTMQDLISGETRKFEEENVQAIINALSLNILQLPLSHITGEEVVAGDVVATYNLLHVLEGILLLSSSAKKQTLFGQKINRFKRREISKEFICKQSSSPLDAEKMFERNVQLKLERVLIWNSHSLKSKSVEKHSSQHVAKPIRSMYLHSCHKSYLLPRKKHASYPRLRNISTKKFDFLQSTEESCKETVSSQTNFIQELLDEFPCIQISPSLIKNIEHRYAFQLLRLHKIMKNCLLKRSKACLEAENVSKRQHKLAEIFQKDIQQQQYLKEMKEEKENERKIKYSLRDSRIKSAKMKQYSDEFVENMRKKMLKTTTKEELIFKKVFKEIMDIQSEHVDYLCQQMREAKMNDDEQYLNYLYSLENLYQSQYLALSEEIANERSDVQLRLNAEKQALVKAERLFRESLKKEIRGMQKIIVEQTEDCYFREIDATLYIDEKRKQIQ